MEDVCGDDSGVAPRGAPAPGRSSSRAPRSSGRALVADSAAGSQARSDDECFVCREASGDLSKQYRGFSFHGWCWNGVRCYQRLLRGKKAKDDEQKMFNQEPQQWRDAVLPLVVLPGQGYRPISARAEVRSRIEKREEHFSSKALVSDVLRLTKPRYKAYMKFWEQWGSDEASSDFEKEVEKQPQPLEDRNGARVVEVEDNGRVRTSEGVRHSDVTISGQDPGADAPLDRAPARSRTPPPHRPPSDPCRLTADSLLSFSRMGGRSQGCAESSCAAGAAIDSGGEDNASSAPATSVKKQTLVEFMHSKKELVRQCDAISNGTLLRSSVVPRMERCLAKMTADQLRDVLGDPGAAVKDIKRLAEKILSLKAEVEDCRQGGLEDLREKVAAAKMELDLKSTAAEEVYDGLRFVLDQGSDKHRKNMQHLRYRRMRIGNRLVTGGYLEHYATKVTYRLQDPSVQDKFIQTNPLSFDPERIGIWDKIEGEIAEGIDKLRMDLAPVVDSKRSSLQQVLENNHSFTGAMARLEASSLDITRLSKACKYEFGSLASQGHHPWLVTLRKWSFRAGPGAFPLPGMGAFVWAENPGTLMLHCFRASDFVNQGLVVLSDMAAFLETASGLKTLGADNWFIIDLRQKPASAGGAFVFIPYGFIVWPLYMPLDIDEPVSATQQNLQPGQGFTYFSVLTVFSAALIAQLPPPAWTAIENHNKIHMERQAANSPLWANRGQSLAAVSAAVERQSS